MKHIYNVHMAEPKGVLKVEALAMESDSDLRKESEIIKRYQKVSTPTLRPLWNALSANIKPHSPRVVGDISS
jgi:hypothetical protein